ncbi:MAG: hypothetical protein UT34_C0001G0298 [candidate division WS6 bacterium GW2011_GWF2_39_15]|uniref:Uncharacterized protein n=1 Tax=candidate division WS6 bacterium GW2011_GWF2_39_15 TaxID=1619100 RepID=A0A0G0MSY3_9BACT|nr:MAG: hypothetical protein UT34_C0001G0298 [candidate division WS6 bacterium GW2011_GWF2_39_15]
MEIQNKVATLKLKLIDPMIYDITEILNITANKTGQDNHGVQLMAMISVLVAIETVSQFIISEALEAFVIEAKSIYKGLSKVQKLYTLPRIIPQGINSPITFMENYFEPIFKNTVMGEINLNLAEMIWKFRNSQAHAFYPFMLEDRSVRGRVNWMYQKPSERKGISIHEIELLNKTTPQAVYGIEEGEKGTKWIAVNVQVLFVYFKIALDKYFQAINSDTAVAEVFLRNYQRLKTLYMFE